MLRVCALPINHFRLVINAFVHAIMVFRDTPHPLLNTHIPFLTSSDRYLISTIKKAPPFWKRFSLILIKIILIRWIPPDFTTSEEPFYCIGFFACLCLLFQRILWRILRSVGRRLSHSKKATKRNNAIKGTRKYSVIGTGEISDSNTIILVLTEH